MTTKNMFPRIVSSLNSMIIHLLTYETIKDHEIVHFYTLRNEKSWYFKYEEEPNYLSALKYVQWTIVVLRHLLLRGNKRESNVLHYIL